MTRTLYEILGVAPSASLRELQVAYNKIKRELGKAGDPASMQALQIASEAYRVLSDPDRRYRYDQKHARRAEAEPHDAVESDPAWRGTLPAVLQDFPEHFPPPPPPPMPMRGGGGRWDDFSFMHKPPFLVFLLRATVFLYNSLQAEKMHRLEDRLQANEIAMAKAMAEKNASLKAREEAQAQIELAKQQHDDSEAEIKRLDLEKRKLDLESKHIDVEQSAVDANKEVALKQIESSAAIANRSLDVKTQTEAQIARSQARSIELDNREKEFSYIRRVQDEGFAIRAEAALRDKYREQELAGEDKISRSNPGLGHYIEITP